MRQGHIKVFIKKHASHIVTYKLATFKTSVHILPEEIQKKKGEAIPGQALRVPVG
jgi:hypothetical protein